MEYIGDYIKGSDNMVRFIRDELSQFNFNDRRKLIFKLFNDLVSALDYIHNIGYVHRDIRPENIFVQKPSVYN